MSRSCARISWRTAENSAAYLLPHLAPTAKVLDVGCGPGTITAGLADRVPRGHVTGIDAAQESLTRLVRRAATGQRRLRRRDVYALDYPDASFCVVHAHQVLQHLSDPVLALTEMRRVTRPGGLVAVRDADYGAMTGTRASRYSDWLALYLRQVARGNGGEPNAGRHLHAWARAAGFTDVTARRTNWTYATEAGTGVVGRPVGGPTVKSSYAASA